MTKEIMDSAAPTELDRLTAELALAHTELDAAFRTEPPGAIAKGDNLSRYLAEAQKVMGILRRIRRISETS